MTIDQLLVQSKTTLNDPISLCAEGSFRWGSCQAILYDPRRADLFPQPFLYSLYERTRLSGQRHPRPLDLNDRGTLGALIPLFCGMTNLGPDSICKYLSERAVCVVGEWRSDQTKAMIIGDQVEYEDYPPTFHPLGYCFPSTLPSTSPLSLTGVPSNSVFAGYTLFSDCWRTPQQTVLMYLGLAWLFHTFQLVALHGSRYSTNHLTRRWTRQFGFRDCGELPYCMPGPDGAGGELASGVFSTLLRTDFEARLREVLEKVRGGRQSSGQPVDQ
jgi:hypothetical protein